MSKITYNAELLKIMTLFETVTRTRLKDAFVDNNGQLTFVVDDTYLGKAIGKAAANVRRLEHLLKRKIKILGFNPEPEEFIRHLLYPLEADVEVSGPTVTISDRDSKVKGLIIGRNRSNVNNMLSIIQKYFRDIKEIKVV